MAEQTNIDHKDEALSATVRSTNHVRPHPVHSTKTLMRRAVVKPVFSTKAPTQIKAHTTIYHESIKPGVVRTVNSARLERVSQIQRSQFISHMAKPDTRPFVQPSQPIKSILSKPRLEDEEASIDNLLHRAMGKLSSEVDTLEQIPLRTMQRFTRALVANRFNGIALD